MKGVLKSQPRKHFGHRPWKLQDERGSTTYSVYILLKAPPTSIEVASEYNLWNRAFTTFPAKALKTVSNDLPLAADRCRRVVWSYLTVKSSLLSFKYKRILTKSADISCSWDRRFPHFRDKNDSCFSPSYCNIGAFQAGFKNSSQPRNHHIRGLLIIVIATWWSETIKGLDSPM